LQVSDGPGGGPQAAKSPHMLEIDSHPASEVSRQEHAVGGQRSTNEGDVGAGGSATLRGVQLKRAVYFLLYCTTLSSDRDLCIRMHRRSSGIVCNGPSPGLARLNLRTLTDCEVGADVGAATASENRGKRWAWVTKAKAGGNSASSRL